ncbi:MAG: class I SAM-dependent methyltransferase [Limnochordales bacterium]|jgi:16S RNA G1207 methylase RsmC|nr:16S rRNA methyltransferase [Bacillota bacterium]
MTEHYYTAKPQAPHRPREVAIELRGRRYVFLTDAGVFSKGRVDPGTRLLIEHLPLPVTGWALDLGCGYGAIGLVIAAESPQAQVLMVDVNERAVELARKNLARNGVRNAQVLVSDGYAAVGDVRFALIASNPPIRAGKRVIYPWVDEAYARLEPGGRLLMVARTSQGAKSLAKKIAEVFGNVTEVAKGSGYRVMEAVRAGA